MGNAGGPRGIGYGVGRMAPGAAAGRGGARGGAPAAMPDGGVGDGAAPGAVVVDGAASPVWGLNAKGRVRGGNERHPRKVM
jgi:hypothetical protein